MRSMVEGFFQTRRTPPPRFARSPSPGNPGEELGMCPPFLRIDRLDEIQPLRRRVQAERGPIPRFQRRPQIRRAPFAPADQLQAADHRAHLVVEEGARRRLYEDGLALAPDVE